MDNPHVIPEEMESQVARNKSRLLVLKFTSLSIRAQIPNFLIVMLLVFQKYFLTPSRPKTFIYYVFKNETVYLHGRTIIHFKNNTHTVLQMIF